MGMEVRWGWGLRVPEEEGKKSKGRGLGLTLFGFCCSLGEVESEGQETEVAPACWGESEKWQGRPVCRRKNNPGGEVWAEREEEKKKLDPPSGEAVRLICKEKK